MSKHDCDDDPDCQYCHHVCALQPVREPPPVPEAPALLVSQGLRVVTEAEWRVLEACKGLTVDDRDDVYTVNGWVPVAEAELARRGKP